VEEWRDPYMGRPAHLPYRGIALTGTDITTKLKFIYGHDHAVVIV
jgi:hypothetical protein